MFPLSNSPPNVSSGTVFVLRELFLVLVQCLCSNF
jgi:hypothetical protein